MEENKNNNKTKDNKEMKKDFNIIVTYAEKGPSFQSIAENILIRKMNEI